MATFLEEVALRLYEKYGDEVSSLTILLPTKRARLFLAEALAKVAVRPIWEPEYASIDDLMCQCSGLDKVDRLRLVAELYKVYSRYHKENFEEFYSWGEILVSDFDMLDKYDVDASQLFSNIRDLKELEADMSYLTPEQVMMINRFWRTIVGTDDKIVKEDSVKSRFLEIWSTLGTIYEEFRANLRKMNVGYTGMIYREAVERLDRGEVELPQGNRYAFIGFNALSTCEKRLLRHIQNCGQSEFYWDYDNYYKNNKFQEAGMFVRENVEIFGEERGISHDNFNKIGSIDVLSTSSSVAQCQCVIDVLEDIAARNGGILDKDTAIVLTDENLLMPLLYALPDKFKRRSENVEGDNAAESAINVTMGYPLSKTFAYSFVERLLSLQKHSQYDKQGVATFYHADVVGLLSHPYIVATAPDVCESLRARIIKHRHFYVPASLVAATPLLQSLFCKTINWCEQSRYLSEIIDAIFATPCNDDDLYRNEFLTMAKEAIERLHNILEQCQIEEPDKLYNSLLRRYLQGVKAPFTGEPLEGLQIMGILETRNLDFKNVILLSMNDSNFPGSHATDKSFIPYSLRYGFDIPTTEHHEGVYAYYFYRLIERAERVYMVYSTMTNNNSTGEPSRYIRQLEYETDFDITHTNVGVEVSLSQDESEIVVEKSPEIFDKVLRYTRDKGLSPTAISTYVRCPLQFYFNYIEYIRQEDELEESVDALTFGNIFHKAADLLYAQLEGDAEPNKRLEEMRESGEVKRCVDAAIAKVYFNLKEGEPLPQLRGELHIIRNIVYEYLNTNLLNYDIKHHDFSVMETEYDMDITLPIEVGTERFDVKIEGRADRVDSLNNGMLRVIDYKTGKEALTYKSIESLFNGMPIMRNRHSNIINTLLYSMMLSKRFNRDVRPELYYVGSMVKEDYSPLFIEKSSSKQTNILNAYSECAEEFEREICGVLEHIFDRTIPFSRTEDTNVCVNCYYNNICNRK